MADKLLLDFCRGFEHLYGGENTTMNMHLHCHLKSTVLLYGPVYAYWLFSFERFNGILGSIPTNNRSIEAQLMKRFVLDTVLNSDSVSKTLLDCDMQKIFSSRKKLRGSVAKQISADDVDFYALGPFTQESFDKEDCDDITALFAQTEYVNSSVKCLRLYRKHKAVTDGERVYGSLTSRLTHNCIVFVLSRGALKVCQIQFFCNVTLAISNDNGDYEHVSHLVAVVRWHQSHPNHQWFSPPTLVYCNLFEPWRSFIVLKDIQCVAGTCIMAVKFAYGEETVVCAVPLQH